MFEFTAMLDGQVQVLPTANLFEAQRLARKNRASGLWVRNPGTGKTSQLQF